MSTETWEPSERQKMKSMTEQAGGELCLPQRPHNQVWDRRRIFTFPSKAIFLLHYVLHYVYTRKTKCQQGDDQEAEWWGWNYRSNMMCRMSLRVTRCTGGGNGAKTSRLSILDVIETREENYQGIEPLKHAFNMYGSVMDKRLRQCNCQFGFMSGRETTYALFIHGSATH